MLSIPLLYIVGVAKMPHAILKCTAKVFIYSADKCVCTHQLLKNRHFLRKLQQHRPFLSFLPIIAVVFFSFSECRSTIADFDSVLSLRASVRPELSVQGCLSERPPARDFGQGQPSAGPARGCAARALRSTWTWRREEGKFCLSFVCHL